MQLSLDWFTIQSIALLNEKVTRSYQKHSMECGIIRDISMVVELDTADINMLYSAIANMSLYSAKQDKASVRRYANLVQISVRFGYGIMIPFLLHSIASARSLQAIFRFWSMPQKYNNALCMSWNIRNIAYERLFCEYFHGLVDANLFYTVSMYIRFTSCQRYMDRLKLSILGVPFTTVV